MSSSSWKPLRVLCALLSVFLLMVALVESRRTVDVAAVVPAASVTVVGNSKHLSGGGRAWSLPQQHSRLFFVSKRRVPNGADPIHNRRAGKSGRPPGRV